MANIKISKAMINSIASQNNAVFLNKTNRLIKNVISASVKNLGEKVSYVTNKNVVLQPVNEILNNSFTDNSMFVYFLGISNAQLELNTQKKTNFWKELFLRFKVAWLNRRKRKSKKIAKKKEENDTKIVNENYDPSKYSIYSLSEDMQNLIAKYLSETSLIYLKGNEITIVGKDDFGANTKIKIYCVIYNEEFFRYYAGRRKGFIDIDLNNRCKVLSEKISRVGDNFTMILKVLNALYYNVNSCMPNQIYIESVLCSIPDEMFEGEEAYSVFVKIINYITLKTIKNTKSINNENKTIFEDNVCGDCTMGFIKMMNLITGLSKN